MTIDQLIHHVIGLTIMTVGVFLGFAAVLLAAELWKRKRRARNREKEKIQAGLNESTAKRAVEKFLK